MGGDISQKLCQIQVQQAPGQPIFSRFLILTCNCSHFQRLNAFQLSFPYSSVMQKQSCSCVAAKGQEKKRGGKYPSYVSKDLLNLEFSKWERQYSSVFQKTYALWPLEGHVPAHTPCKSVWSRNPLAATIRTGQKRTILTSSPPNTVVFSLKVFCGIAVDLKEEKNAAGSK